MKDPLYILDQSEYGSLEAVTEAVPPVIMADQSAQQQVQVISCLYTQLLLSP